MPRTIFPHVQEMLRCVYISSKTPPLVRIISQMNPVNAFIPCFYEIQLLDIVTCRPVAGQRLGKHVPAETDSG
jgi:hypothetical protein